MDKETNKALLINNKEIRAEKTFVAEKNNGIEKLEFTFDSTSLNNKEIVVFEDLIRDKKQVATHSDINDIGQTVKFRKISKNPNTGDSFQIARAILMSMFGLTAIGLMSINKKKVNRK